MEKYEIEENGIFTYRLIDTIDGEKYEDVFQLNISRLEESLWKKDKSSKEIKIGIKNEKQKGIALLHRRMEERRNWRVETYFIKQYKPKSEFIDPLTGQKIKWEVKSYAFTEIRNISYLPQSIENSRISGATPVALFKIKLKQIVSNT